MAEASVDQGPYDVAVVGGGMIGAAAALGLARQGRRVLLLEPRRPEVRRGLFGWELRTVALSPASRRLLEELGVWAGLPRAPYRRMEVWEERGTQAMIFDAAEVDRDELGWIVENGPATLALWDALAQRPEVTIAAAPVTGVAPGPEAATVALGDASVTAGLVVAADGAASPVREGLGVSLQTFDVGHMAVATAARFARAHEATAYQRFLIDGPLALLPGRDPRVCSVIWSQSPERARQRLALDAGDFAAALTRATQGRLGDVEAVDARVGFPLSQQLAASFAPHPRVLLVGDAARVLHPLAGQGANLGLEDVRDLLAVLDQAGGGDPGAPGLWRAFDRQRTARARFMVGVMGALRRVYAQGDPVSQLLRNLGVRWLDRAAPVKRQIMQEAMGLGPVGRGLAGAR